MSKITLKVKELIEKLSQMDENKEICNYSISFSPMCDEEDIDSDEEEFIHKEVEDYIMNAQWHVRCDGVIETNEDWKLRAAWLNHHMTEYDLNTAAMYFYKLGLQNAKKADI